MSRAKHRDMVQFHADVPLLISLQGVSRQFPGVRALNDVSMEIRKGEFVAIVGQSGSGKSTLLNVLGLLDEATSGAYLLHGSDVTKLKEKTRTERRARTFGFIFQESHMVGRDTAARNASLGLRARGISFKLQKQLVMPTLRQFGLQHRTHTLASQLSGGERQRLAIARAVMGSPEVVLADEPTGSLDSINGGIVLNHLRELHAKGATIIMVTHDAEIAASANRIITMRDGRIVTDENVPCPEPKTSSSVISVAEAHPVPQYSAIQLNRRFRHEAVDVVADAVSSLTVRPGKAFLLILAFLLGSAGLVASIGLSESAATGVASRIDAAASDEVRASRIGGYASWKDVSTDLDHALRLAGVEEAGILADLPASEIRPSALRPESVPNQPTFGGGVRVISSSYLTVMGATVTGGQPALLDNSFDRPVAMLGTEAARELGIGRPGPNVVVWLYGQPVPVVGIISDPGRDPVLAGAIVVGVGSYPMTERTGVSIVVRTDPGTPAAIAEAIPRALNPAKTSDIEVEVVADLRDLKAGISSDLGRLVAVISGILLVIACLSAGTTMYLGVLARSSEIALRRALGMRRISLASMFLLEGGVVGLIGGAAGGAAGMIAVLVYASNEGWISVIPWYASLLGIAVGAVSGTLSALYPAVAASKANPAQLIRG